MSTGREARSARSVLWAWATYDLANTIFALGVAALYLPTWLIDVAGYDDLDLAIAVDAAMLAVIVLAPWIGARTDAHGGRVRVLRVTTLVAVAATATLASLPPPLTLAAFSVALVAFNLGSVVYDALLPTVAPPEARGRASGLGVGVGYVGSFIGLAIGVVVLDVLGGGYPATFAALAAGFAVFAIPALVLIPDPPPAGGRPPGISDALRHLVQAWRRARATGDVARFLVGRFLYADAINTLIGGFLAIYVQTELGFTRTEVQALLGVAIVGSILGGLLGGGLVDRVGAKRFLLGMLTVWFAAFAVGIVAGLLGWRWLGWLLGPIGGFALGGTWTADRVVMAQLSPPERYGELYGLYATVGRFATLLGPAVWGVMVRLGAPREAAMAVLAGFVAAAWLTIRPVRAR